MPNADELLKRLPEKITTYGGDDDRFVKMVETFEKIDDETIRVNRNILCKSPIERIVLDLKIDP